jgi:hypothetical protein
VKLPENYKGTVIVACIDINYWPAGKIWFQRMKTLGYTNVRMYALDQLAYQEMLAEVALGNMKTENVHLPKDFGVEMVEVAEHHNKSNLYRIGNLSKVWKIRVDVTIKLLKQGYSVFQSDIDSLWLKYIDLDSLPLNFDILWSIAGKFPPAQKRKWGFTLCGCLMLYRPTELTLKWFDLYTASCKNKCDDQRNINGLLDMGRIRWLDKSELSPQHEVWQGPIDYHTIGIFDGKDWMVPVPGNQKSCEKERQQGGNCTIIPDSSVAEKKSGSIEWNHRKFDLTGFQLGIVSQKVWMRNGGIKDCIGKNENTPWIMNPGISKIGSAKVKMFETFKSCF